MLTLRHACDRVIIFSYMTVSRNKCCNTLEFPCHKQSENLDLLFFHCMASIKAGMCLKLNSSLRFRNASFMTSWLFNHTCNLWIKKRWKGNIVDGIIEKKWINPIKYRVSSWHPSKSLFQDSTQSCNIESSYLNL